MDLTPTHITLINLLLPGRYKIDIATKIDSRPVILMQRKSEAENLDFNVRFQPRVPEKRQQREKVSPSDDYHEENPKLTEGYKRLSKILTELKKHPKIENFLYPANIKPYSDYSNIITEPMDLSSVENKLQTGEYESGYQFALDMRLI